MLIVGLDLGQVHDFTALAVLEVTGERPRRTYAARHLERWRGLSYPAQVARVQTRMHTPELREVELLVDQTGVGRPVVDALRAAGLSLRGVSIHGGDAVTQVDQDWRVPKRDLAAVVAVLLQGRRLKIAQALPEAATLTRELAAFRVKIDPQTSHDSYAAWREADRDDLVLAVALAAWWGECGTGGWRLL
jgi:hypothetical protein